MYSSDFLPEGRLLLDIEVASIYSCWHHLDICQPRGQAILLSDPWRSRGLQCRNICIALVAERAVLVAVLAG